MGFLLVASAVSMDDSVRKFSSCHFSIGAATHVLCHHTSALVHVGQMDHDLDHI